VQCSAWFLFQDGGKAVVLFLPLVDQQLRECQVSYCRKNLQLTSMRHSKRLYILGFNGVFSTLRPILVSSCLAKDIITDTPMQDGKKNKSNLNMFFHFPLAIYRLLHNVGPRFKDYRIDNVPLRGLASAK